MNWFKKIIGGGHEPERVDYYAEAMELVRAGSLHEALTSLRLALKESPGDALVLQQIAIIYTRIGMLDEAAKTYQHVLQRKPDAAGAHYGLAFLLLRAGAEKPAASHLQSFLNYAPTQQDAAAHVDHAKQTLQDLLLVESDGSESAVESA